MISLLQTRRVFVFVLALGLFAMAARGVNDPDLWWHLRTGQLMVQNHSLFHTDPYSFTRFGQPWINHEWLSQILLFGLYRVFGFGGLIVSLAAVIAVTLMLVFARCPGRPYLAAVITLWGAVASSPAWGVRPQMFSLLLASIFLLLLESSERHPKLLWWTVPLMLLWVNLHAGYPIGLAFLAFFIIGETLQAAVRPGQWTQAAVRLKALVLVFLLCLAVVALNPNGLRIYAYPFETLRSAAMQRFIQEWFSPNFHDAMYLPLLLMLLALVAGLALSPRRIHVRSLVLLLATVPAALRSMRHIPILVLVMAPVLADVIESWLEQNGVGQFLQLGQRPPTRRTVVANVLVLVAFSTFTLLRVRQVTTSQAQTEAQHFPQAAAAFLGHEHPPGPILNHYNFGGYFIWKLYPQYLVFIDGRADVYGDQFMNQFAAAYHLTEEWNLPLDQWAIRTVVLPPDAPLITALRGNPSWTQLYADSTAVVLTRRQ